MDQKRYRRYFIILDQEDSGFENKQGKKTKGYAKLETKNGKGVLSQYIQNMKYFDDGEYIYRGYLIGTKGNKQIYSDNGTFMIDKNGKGELVWKFDPENVDGQGNSIGDFNVIAVVAESIDQRDKVTVAPLVGFIDKKKVDWKHILKNRYKNEEKIKGAVKTREIVQEKEKSNEELDRTSVKEEITEVVEKENIEEENIKKEKAVEEDHIETVEKENMEDQRIESTKTEERVEEIHRASIKKADIEEVGEKEKFEIKDTKALKEERVEEDKRVELTDQTEEKIKGQKEVKVKREDFTQNYRCKEAKGQHEHIDYGEMKYYDCKNPYQYYHQYAKMICGYVENILKYHHEVEPFQKNIGNCKWWKIDASQQTLYRNFLPFYGYVRNMYCYPLYRNYVGCPPQIYKYKHYIFGLMRDKKNDPSYYVYGIPGRFMFSEQPYEGVTGFVYWHPIEEKKPEKGDYGYWILHIDAKTGNVAIPLKPTIPPK
ncbi:MAG: hypothetical protein N4A64_13010 [Marinisporobacter sp.]|nr:hypothetical protein [Marinisporobacter sp.]